jgi:hypothetical protein
MYGTRIYPKACDTLAALFGRFSCLFIWSGIFIKSQRLKKEVKIKLKIIKPTAEKKIQKLKYVCIFL